MKKLALIIGCLLFLASCANYDYYAISKKQILNSGYQTFAWIPETQSKAKSTYDNDIATDRIVEAATVELGKKGLVLNSDNPDLLVKYTAVVNTETKTYNNPVYYNPPARFSPRFGYYRGRPHYYYRYIDPMPIYVGNRAQNLKIKEGSIMIDLIDRKSKKLVWRGWAEGEVSNPQKAIDDIPNVVANIFKKLN